MYDSYKNSRKKRCLSAIIAPEENGGKGTSFFGNFGAFVETPYYDVSLQAFFNFPVSLFFLFLQRNIVLKIL